MFFKTQLQTSKELNQEAEIIIRQYSLSSYVFSYPIWNLSEYHGMLEKR